MAATPDAAADERWAAARAIADVTVDPAIDARRIRRFRNTVLFLAWVLTVGLLCILFRELLRWGDPLSTSGTDTTASLVVGYTVQGFGFVVWLVSFVVVIRPNRSRARSSSSPSPLNTVEQEWVVQQIRTGAPVEEDNKRVVVLSMCAAGRRLILSMSPLLIGPVLIVLGAGIRMEFVSFAWFAFFGSLPIAVAYVYFRREFRLRGEYLRRFGASSPEAQQR